MDIFTPTHLPRTAVTPKGFVRTQRGIVNGVDCIKLFSTPNDSETSVHIILSLEGAKAVVENLLAALAETPEDPAQAKLSLG